MAFEIEVISLIRVIIGLVYDTEPSFAASGSVPAGYFFLDPRDFQIECLTAEAALPYFNKNGAFKVINGHARNKSSGRRDIVLGRNTKYAVQTRNKKCFYPYAVKNGNGRVDIRANKLVVFGQSKKDESVYLLSDIHANIFTAEKCELDALYDYIEVVNYTKDNNITLNYYPSGGTGERLIGSKWLSSYIKAGYDIKNIRNALLSKGVDDGLYLSDDGSLCLPF